MEIILLEKVSGLGNIGEIVKVKNGFARNFLIPRGRAARATEENKKSFEERRAAIAAENAAKKAAAEKSVNDLPDSIIIVRQAGEDGRLFGSVSARDISSEITNSGSVEVNKTQIESNNVIKYLGDYFVNVILHPEVKATVKVIIARSQEEGELHRAKGKEQSAE